AHSSWLAPDGRTLAVVEGEQLSVWDTTSGQRRQLLAVNPMHVAFAPGGRLLATAEYVKGKGRIRLWDLTTGKDRLFAELPSYANDVAFGPRGQRLFAAVDNHSLRCWDVGAASLLWQNVHWASNLIVAPDGKLVCSDTYLGGPLHLWD